MSKHSNKKTPQQMVEAIFALDLDPIKVKLMDKSEGHGWTRAQADRNELEYKRFLALLAKYPEQSIAPTSEVDKFWHGHILDTMKYAEDCNNIFGYFLHHFPYFGMRGEEDAANLVDAFLNMQRLRDAEFGLAGQATSQGSAWCGATATQAMEPAATKVAWCGAAVESAQGAARGAAWCGATAAQAEDQKAAWCGAVSGAVIAAAEQGSAWCGAVSGEESQSAGPTSAWCGATAAGPQGANHAKWRRPTLPKTKKAA